MIVRTAFVAALLLIALSEADVNIFEDKTHEKLSTDHLIFKEERVIVKANCSNDDCNDLNLTISREGSVRSPAEYPILPTWHLTKRLTLNLSTETCRYYTGSDPSHAMESLRYCSSQKDRMERMLFEGTFFRERLHERYELTTVSNGSMPHVLMTYRVNMSGKVTPLDAQHLHDSVAQRALKERIWQKVSSTTQKPGYHKKNQSTHPRFKHPTLELVIGIDDSYSSYFNNDQEKVIKEAAMIINTVDAMFSPGHASQADWSPILVSLQPADKDH